MLFPIEINIICNDFDLKEEILYDYQNNYSDEEILKYSNFIVKDLLIDQKFTDIISEELNGT